MQGADASWGGTPVAHTCSASGLFLLPVDVGVLMPLFANGDITDPSGDTSLFAAAAAAAAVDLVVFTGVVSCSLPKGVAGGLAGETLSVAGSASMSWYQASSA